MASATQPNNPMNNPGKSGLNGAKLQSTILTEINSSIIQNGNGLITGPILNGILGDMNAVPSGYYTFPADPGLNANGNDIGKLVMDGGKGTAVVYKLSPSTTQQSGHWTLGISNINNLNANNSSITIKWAGNQQITFFRYQWLANQTAPATSTDELNLINTYMGTLSNLSFLATTVTTDANNNPILDIQESATNFQGTSISTSNFPSKSITVIVVSKPALPAAPTSPPLGVLYGVDGGMALIGNGTICTYIQDGSFGPISNSIFDYNTAIDFNDQNTLINLTALIAIPGDGGVLTSFNLNNFGADNMFVSKFRHQIIGFAIASTPSTVTVMNLIPFTWLGSIPIRALAAGLFN